MSGDGPALSRKRLSGWLKGLKWDRVPRMVTWLPVYLGADWQDPVHLAAVGANFLRSAVARVAYPGCRVDRMLVFKGPQGAGTSSAIRTLAGAEFYAQLSIPVDNKDTCLALGSNWIVELPEFSPADLTDRLKGFLAQRYDEYRLPYEKRVQPVPRLSVFVGTTNHESDLDERESRRFWSVRCGEVRLDDLVRDREQLWAEAVNSFRRGAPWWDAMEKEMGASHGR